MALAPRTPELALAMSKIIVGIVVVVAILIVTYGAWWRMPMRPPVRRRPF